MELQIHFYLHISGLTITWDVFEFPSNTLYRIMRCSLTITWDVFEFSRCAAVHQIHAGLTITWDVFE